MKLVLSLALAMFCASAFADSCCGPKAEGAAAGKSDKAVPSCCAAKFAKDAPTTATVATVQKKK